MKSFILLFIISILSSCASSYKPINPQNYKYSLNSTTNDLKYSITNNILTKSLNKKYANKEIKTGIKLISVKIENTTKKPIVFIRDIEIRNGKETLSPLEPQVINSTMKQSTGLYMLWSLFMISYTECENDNCSSIPIPIGVLIGLLNLGTASTANKDFLTELSRYNILNKEIKPGETSYGIIGVYSNSNSNIYLKLR